MKNMTNWKTFKNELMKDKEFAVEYEKQRPKYELISQLIGARTKNGLTQEQLAKKIGTKQSAIARLESGNTNPSVGFLEKFAVATGSKLIIQVK